MVFNYFFIFLIMWSARSFADDFPALRIAGKSHPFTGWLYEVIEGSNPRIDTADPPATIWEGKTFGANQLYQFSNTNDIDSIICTDPSANQIIKITGLDINSNIVTVNIPLNGQSRVAMTNGGFLKINRVVNTSPIPLPGDVYVYVNGTVTDGIPESDNIRAICTESANESKMALYSMPNNSYKSYILSYNMGLSRMIGSGNETANLFFEGRFFNGPTRTRFNRLLNQNGKSSFGETFPIPIFIEPKTDIILCAGNVSANNMEFTGGFTVLHQPIAN